MGILRTDVISHSQLEGSGSVEFDGDGDSLTFDTSSGLSLDGDFTIEFYIFNNTIALDTQHPSPITMPSESGHMSQIYTNSSNDYYGLYKQSDIVTTGNNSALTGVWQHVAFTRKGSTCYAFLDGVLKNSASSTVTFGGTSGTYRIGSYNGSGGDVNGFISNLRIIKGNALYTVNFTVPKFELKNIPGTILLGCQSTTSATDFAVTPSTVTANNDAVASSFHSGLKKDITDTGVVFDGVTTFDSQAFMVPPSGKTSERNRGRAVMAGGMAYPTVNTNIIEMLEIQSGGQTQDFGDLITKTSTSGPVSSSTRGVMVAGLGPSARTNAIEFVTIASTGNAIDFGDYVSPLGYVGGVSNQTRGVTCGGSAAPYSPNGTNQMAFITIATAGDASDYGDLSGNTQGAMGVQSSTRGVFNLGYVGGFVNTIEFITIATTGDTTDFGDLSRTNSAFGGSCCSSTRGLFAGGYNNTPASVTEVNNIDFITIASTGNSTDFGDLVTAGFYNYGTSNKTRGIFQGRLTTAPYTGDPIIDSVIIASTGNAVEFGQMHRMDSGPHDGQAIVRRGATTVSDSHGGLS